MSDLKTFTSKKNSTTTYALLINIFLYCLILFYSQRCLANQDIIPDNTLNAGEQSIVTDGQIINGNKASLIQGGSLRGSSLFHSFSKFNIENGDSAYFQSSSIINSIFARVTENPSFINGLMGVVGGKSDLFLINSKGIIFGRNAQLDLNGSFTATTANKVVFKNYEFISSKPNSVPLLVIERPIGLYFLEAGGDIVVRNDGVQIFQPNINQAPPVIFQNNPLSLSTTAQNLSILGNKVLFDGGVLKVISGNLTIGSVKNGYVEIDNKTGKYSLSSLSDSNLGNIDFLNYSFIQGINILGGSISIFGDNINILNNSTITSVDFGLQNVDGINISASNDINIAGVSELNIPEGFKRPVFGILSTNFGIGSGSDINLVSKNINVADSGVIFSIANNIGSGGNLFINTSNSFVVTNATSSLPGNNGSSVGSATVGNGRSGNLNIVSPFISISDGSLLSTNTQGTGNAGNVSVKSNKIIVDGFNPINLFPSSLSSVTAGAGTTGNVVIETHDLSVTNGATLGVSTFSSGDAKSVFINAKTIKVSGTYTDPTNGSSRIYASTSTLSDDALFTVFNGTNLDLTGNSGDIIIKTEALEITNGGEILAKNDGTGNAGRISINSDNLILDKGFISIGTRVGNNGSIFIKSNATFLKNSSIFASTVGSGNGGNVDIIAGAFAANHNSSILAQAVRGQGGNINIDAVGIVGSPYVSASSELGIDGSIQIRGEILKRQNSVKVSPQPVIPTFKQQCIPGSEEGKLIGVTRDFINDEVLDNLAARPEQLKFVDDTDGGKIKPLIRERGYVRRSDGKLEFVYMIPADAVISSSQNQNVCTLLKSAEG
jgi:filamentous hemagglutinin family protein